MIAHLTEGRRAGVLREGGREGEGGDEADKA